VKGEQAKLLHPRKAYLVSFVITVRVTVASMTCGIKKSEDGIQDDAALAAGTEVIREPWHYFTVDNLMDFKEDEDCPLGTFADDPGPYE
jgi:hypothetical protein